MKIYSAKIEAVSDLIKFQNNSSLAIQGGSPAITHPKPHWIWPPRSEAKLSAVTDYLKSEAFNDRGYPRIVEELERKFAAFTERKFALALNSGTSALHAAFIAADLADGDEVLVPSMTFPSTASPLFQTGATPIFCDAEPDTGNISPGDAEQRITARTKAIVITHLCGHPCELDQLLNIAGQRGLTLIEDCSHAHCSTYKGKIIGSEGDIAIFSMDNKKLLASGEGGMLVTNDRSLFERALIASDYGPRLVEETEEPANNRYYETGLGLKHRIHPVSAAIAVEQLPHLQGYADARISKLAKLSDALELLPGISPPVTRPGMTRGAYFGYRPFFNSGELKGIGIGEFVDCLRAEGMEVRQSSNPPLHKLPLFVDNYEYLADYSLPAAEAFFATTLSLPTFTFEPDSLIDEYISAFDKVCTYFAGEG